MNVVNHNTNVVNQLQSYVTFSTR